MSSDAWPSPDAAPEPLPRVEDLPLADHGYDQEAVRLAFDSFYRHAAQLDASLRALEAVEAFQRDADALRNDLRALRALGLGGASAEPAWATQRYEPAPRSSVPGVVLRFAAEAALIIAIAVIAGVADLSTVAIVALMGGAFLVVAISEWLAARARFVPPAVAFMPVESGEPAPYVEVPGPGWSSEPPADTDALTMIESPGSDGVVVDPWEQSGADGAGEPEPEAAGDEAEPEPAESGGGLLRRRRR